MPERRRGTPTLAGIFRQPSQPTSSILGARPKTALPPKALPLSLPGPSSGPPDPSGTMRVMFARPAAVVPDAKPPSRAADARATPLSSAAHSCTPSGQHVVDHDSSQVCCRPPTDNEGSRRRGGTPWPDATPKSASLPTIATSAARKKGPAKVDKSRLRHSVLSGQDSFHRSQWERGTSGSQCVMGERPPRMHNSDLGLYPGSSSSSSLGGPAGSHRLLERIQGIGRSARSALLRAFSTEHIYRPQKTETAARVLEKERVGLPKVPPAASAPSSLMTGLKARMSLRRKSKPGTTQEATDGPNAAPGSVCSDPIWADGQPTDVSCQLLQRSPDGTQVVELRRPPGRSFGFFLARGRVRSHHGVFVSRMHDARTKKELQSLLEVGDEILEVNGIDVRDADIMTVNSLMKNRTTLLLTVLPYICRKDT